MAPETVIEIQGDLIRRIQRTVVAEADLKAILPHMEHQVPVTVPILPKHPARAVHWNPQYSDDLGPGKMLHLLIEVPPAIRTITWEDYATRVSMPWTVWNIVAKTRAQQIESADWNLENMQIFWAQNQISTLDQIVIPARVPNVYDDGAICFGDTGVDPYMPLADRIDQLINDFYGTRFNDDVGTPWPWGESSPDRWIEETQASRSCWRNFPEWDAANPIAHYALKDLFNYDIARGIPRTLGNDIPPLTFLPTFGRTREWLDGLTNAQRLRLRTEIETMAGETPDRFEATDD